MIADAEGAISVFNHTRVGQPSVSTDPTDSDNPPLSPPYQLEMRTLLPITVFPFRQSPARSGFVGRRSFTRPQVRVPRSSRSRITNVSWAIGAFLRQAKQYHGREKPRHRDRSVRATDQRTCLCASMCDLCPSPVRSYQVIGGASRATYRVAILAGTRDVRPTVAAAIRGG
jgi:hypothetical protein